MAIDESPPFTPLKGGIDDSGLKTVVGLFDDLSEARGAVQELASAGFSRDGINLIANASADEYSTYFDPSGAYLAETPTVTDAEPHSGAATGAGVGAILGGLGGLLLGLSMVPVPGVGPILAAGPITTALIGAIGGGLVGGLLGALTTVGVPEEHAGYYAEGVRRGGTLVIVKTVQAQVTRVTDILNRHDPVNVEERVSSWRQSGWSGFDQAATPYNVDQIAAERRTYNRSGVGTGVGTAGGALGGAAVGAAAGSILPGAGTAAGAVVGGVAGAAAGGAVGHLADRNPTGVDRNLL